MVLDASAMIALLANEIGGQYVTTYIEAGHPIFAHALNLCEVYYHFYRANGETTADDAIADLSDLRVGERNDMQSDFWRTMSTLKALHKRVSLADCAALVLARKLDALLLTADRHELERIEELSICRIKFIR